jgi:pimeloyl-ACP methyl ester carboxylesterase
MSRLHRLLRKPFFGRFEVPWEWPSPDEEARWQRVNFRSGNGARLAGIWGPAEGIAQATLVLAHPMGKAAKGFWLRHGHAALFRRSGFHVLAFDANGFGESEPASFDYPSDFLAAGQWAREREPALPVGLVGASFGAGWGLCSMARAGSPYRAAVLEGTFPTLPEFWRHYPVAYATLRASQFVWPQMERNLRPEREAARVLGNPPVLLLYGDQDIYTPPAHGERLLKALAHSARAEMHVFPGVGHTFAYRDAAEAYAARVIPFLRAALAATLLAAGAALAQDCPRVDTALQAAAEKQCRAAGGEWARFGVRDHLCNVYSCAPRTKDGGKPCRHRADCEYQCAHEAHAALGAEVTGRCAVIASPFGCVYQVDGGRIVGRVCTD